MPGAPRRSKGKKMTAQRPEENARDSTDPSSGDAEQDPGNSASEAADGDEAEVERLRREIEEGRDQFLRLAAELDNFRKRSARDVDNARKFGIERFAQALLPVYDSIEASLAIQQTDVASLLEGQRATLRLLEEAFASVGVEQIDPHGHPFDPAKHEAMAMLPSAHAEPHSVVDVVQKGYAIQERLLRPARVVVAEPPAEESED